MSSFQDEIKYPVKYGGFTIYRDYGICDTCGERIEGGGIIVWSSHWSKCAGKEQFDKVIKIKDMPLEPEDKMDLIKNLFNINQ